MNSTKRNIERIWSTPQPIFDALDREFQFTIDLCADAGNAKCSRWLPRDLSCNWNGEGIGWLNPPYGRGISGWVEKAVESTRIIVAALPGRTNAPWWHDYVMQAKQIRFVRRKVSFVSPDGYKGVPPWGLVIAIFYPYGKPGYFQRDRWTPQALSWDWRVPFNEWQSTLQTQNATL